MPARASLKHIYNKEVGLMFDNPFNAIGMIAERRIEEALKAGEFDNLPGMGKPLKLEDESNVAPELRLGYRILKNAGYLPPELADRREIENLLDLLEKAEDEGEKVRQIRKLEFMLLRAGMRRQRSIMLEHTDPYYEKALNRLAAIRKKK